METVVQEIARAIVDGFDRHYRSFRTISSEAKRRFEIGDWAAVQRASVERIELYDRRVTEGVARVEAFPEAANEQNWAPIKRAFIAELVNHQQPELAQTYFNSVASRVLHRRYYNNENLFLRSIVSTEHILALQPTYRAYYPKALGLRATLRRMVTDLGLTNSWEAIERDLAAVIRAMSDFFARNPDVHDNVQVQVLSSLFYRNQAAYMIGMIINGYERTPFAVPIRQNARRELYLDALLLHRQELGALFSLARAYFMVDMEVPAAFVSFLRQIFPDKPNAELYTALGLQKQGKTLFYRDMTEHLQHSSDSFAAAPGIRGMVMVVFTLPSFPYVFKVIRDRFEAPKNVDRKTVMAQYRLVKHHDRVGRLADTLEFSYVAFPKDRFEPALLAELEDKAPSMVQHVAGNVVLQHLYVERRMVPLDLYVQRAKDDDELRGAMREYGNCIRELALANIFPGDLLLKNFGVTRFGRVVFYDFDEIQPLTSVNFRRLPTPVHDEDEYRAEAWFSVGPNDVFPEEMPPFLFAKARYKELFDEEHPGLFTADYWRNIQSRVAAGEHLPFYPYPTDRRFPHKHAENADDVIDT